MLHLLWWRLLATPGGDIAAQDAWAAFAKAHPGSAYDLAWYGGMHPVSYSAISPYLMAFLGVRPTMVVAGTLAAGLLAVLLERSRHISSPMLPAVFGALALTGNAVSGRVTFGLGLLFGLAALVAVYAWPADRAGRPALPWLRIATIVVLTALTTAASGVAGLFLGLVAAALWLTGDRRLAYAVGLPPVVVVAVSAWLFPLSGEQPMAWSSAILPTAAALERVAALPARVADAACARRGLPGGRPAGVAGALARRHQHQPARADLRRCRTGGDPARTRLGAVVRRCPLRPARRRGDGRWPP